MFPASTHKGQAVLSFPDVCQTPAAPGPVPMPYPSIGSKQSGKASKAPAGTKMSVAAKSAGPGDLHAALDELHGRIKSMQTDDANAWHEVVDNYFMAVAAVYMSGKNVSRLG